MSSSLFSIGLTGLNAAQAGLVTTSHNISNASTPGYSRQATVQSTNPALFSGSGFFGEGTKVDTIKRAYDSFLTNQVLSADTKYNEYSTYSTQISQIDNMLADSTVGLEPAVDSFFQGVQEVAANPSSVPARQAMISSGQSLVDRFQNLANQLNAIRSGVEGQIKDTVTSISTYAKEISGVNQQIATAQQAGLAQPANDLLDKRDQLVKELNQLVRVSTTTASDGSMSVFIGSGQPLVIGNNPTTLSAEPSSGDPLRNNVNIVTQSGISVTIPESLLGGGKLGGLLAMRANSLDTTQNQLGLIAVGMSAAFNAQHSLGQDLNGNLGSNFFTSPSVTVLADASATTKAPDVTFNDITKLTGDDYRLVLNASGLPSLNRVSTGEVVPLVLSGSTASTKTYLADGLSISVPNTFAAGDSFLIQPTRNAAANINVAISDTRMIAAAAPLTAAAGSASRLATTVAAGNTGTGYISAPVVSSGANLAALQAAPSALNYSAGTLTLSGPASTLPIIYTSATGASVTLTPPLPGIPFTAGMSISIGHMDTISGQVVKDVSFTLDGAPQTGDQFMLNNGRSNLGTASITQPVVLNSAKLQSLQASPTALTYVAGAAGAGGSLSGFSPSTPVTYTLPGQQPQTVLAPVTSVPYVSGMSITLGHMNGTSFVGDVSFSISGAPQGGDTFTVGANPTGVSDSRNAVLLGNLQTTKTLLSAGGQPSATFQSVYAQLVSAVGNKAREVSVNSDAQQSLVDQATQAQQSLVGVNLDEEAANLIRYQQAYQAAGKVMSIASKLFDQVLAMGQ